MYLPNVGNGNCMQPILNHFSKLNYIQELSTFTGDFENVNFLSDQLHFQTIFMKFSTVLQISKPQNSTICKPHLSAINLGIIKKKNICLTFQNRFHESNVLKLALFFFLLRWVSISFQVLFALALHNILTNLVMYFSAKTDSKQHIRR